jgi:hypothetical protein
MEFLCKNLSLSIWLEPAPEWDLIKIRLVDKLAMRKVEITTEPSTNTRNQAYHIEEAIVIALRRLVAQAIKENLISVPLGEQAKPARATRPGVIADITLLIPPDV